MPGSRSFFFLITQTRHIFGIIPTDLISIQNYMESEIRKKNNPMEGTRERLLGFLSTCS